MKLSDLVAFRNALDLVSVDTIKQRTDLELGKIAHLIKEQPSEDFDSSKQELDNNIQDIDQLLDVFDHNIQQLKTQVDSQIEQQEKHWFQESYKLFEEGTRNETPDYVLNRRPQLKTETTLLSRLQMYSDWRYPAMIIRPGLEEFIDHMVAYDPLYIVDTDVNLLGKVPLRFRSEYQSRLRQHVISESIDHDILNKIPDNQFGMCLVYNFFNFRPLEYIRKYLTEIYQKLKPGGVLILTINDCDRSAGVKLAENYYACYTPGKLIVQLSKNIGYDRCYTWHDGGPNTFIEIRKPGELTSLRGGQVLAKVVTIPPSPAELERLAYIEDLEARAVALGVTQVNISKYTVEELKQVVDFREQRQKQKEQQRLLELEQLEEQQRHYRHDLLRLERFLAQQGIDIKALPEHDIQERLKLLKLKDLREQALALNLADSNLIQYVYTAEKLQELIDQNNNKK